jgi:hypothetical protein
MPIQRVWQVKRTTFDRIPIRGLFNFQNGNPSGQYVKISPTTCALPAPGHGNNPHYEYRTVLKRGVGNNQTSASDFAYYQGNTVNAPRSAKVFERNPSGVILESNHGADGA